MNVHRKESVAANHRMIRKMNTGIIKSEDVRREIPRKKSRESITPSFDAWSKVSRNLRDHATGRILIPANCTMKYIYKINFKKNCLTNFIIFLAVLKTQSHNLTQVWLVKFHHIFKQLVHTRALLPGDVGEKICRGLISFTTQCNNK